MDYVTKSEVEQYTGLQIDDTLDAFLDTISAAAKDYIDLFCSSTELGQRWFDDDDVEDTRYFSGNGLSRLYVDDLRSASNLSASITVGSGVTLTENTDYFLMPLNADKNGFPFEYIELVNPAFNLPANSRIQALGGSPAYVFFQGQRNIAITGKWGFNKVSDGAPKAVKLAALKIIAGVIKENIGDTDLKELTAESLGEYSASYAKVKDIADRLEIDDILAQYVRTRVASKGGGNRLLH